MVVRVHSGALSDLPRVGTEHDIVVKTMIFASLTRLLPHRA